MATVIAVEGSAYRHEGAKMLIDAQGNIHGLISGGCLEEDLVHYANEVLQSGKPKNITYDLSSEDDLGWGNGAGCNGIIYVYIEETSWNGLWEKIEQKLLSLQRVVSVTFIDGENHQKNGIYYCEDGEFLNGSDSIGQSLVAHLENSIANEKKTKMITIANHERILIELYKPRERLYIFGAGPDTEPLVWLASKLDFTVYLIDPRRERFEQGSFSTAEQMIEEFPHVYLEDNELHPNSYVLLMTHHFQWDQRALKYLINKPPNYLGILGPKKRTARLLDPNPIPPWIHSPVGMDIQAEGPEEIAISICAELIKYRNMSETKNGFKS